MGAPTRAMSLLAPKTSAVTSASTSAMRSRGSEPRRRRVRCGTWRAFAIGPASLAGLPTPWGGGAKRRRGTRNAPLLDPGVLRLSDLLAGCRIDVEDREDDHEGLVLPHGDVKRLVRDRDAQHDRVLGQTRRSAFDDRCAPALQR